MIEKEYGEFQLVCDVCGEPHDDSPFDDFFEAVDAAKDASWKVERLLNGDWTHTCPKCLNGGYDK